MDYGHKQTDLELKKLEQKILEEYSKASKSVEGKLRAHLDEFKELDAEYSAKVASGDMKKAAYLRWRKSAMMRGKVWRDTRDVLVSDMNNANKIAIGLINNSTIDAYATNMNYGTYEIESGTNLNTSFSLYDHSTVENLLRDDPQIIPQARLDIPEDKRWNRQKLTSAITQGILVGESIPDIAHRLSSVVGMNANAAIRNARTYTTAAENKGRVDSYIRAEGMGIELKQEWMATLDSRTRSSHRQLDGEKQEVGHKFSNGCRYPGDPEGDPWEIYNCRCTLVAAIDGFDDSTVRRFSKLPEGMSYEEWKNAKKQEPKKSETSVLGIVKPTRPRQSDFGGYTEEFLEAREKYKQRKSEYDEAVDRAIRKSSEATAFNSKKELQEWADAKGISIEQGVFDTIDIRSFNEVKSTLEEMFDRYPEIINRQMEGYDGKKIQFEFSIGTTDDGLLSANGGFNFNPRFFDNYENGLRDALEELTDGTLVSGDGSFKTLVRHEYGHNVQEYIETKMRDKYHMTPDDWRLNYSKFDDYREAQEKYKKEREVYEKELRSLAGLSGSSEYSNTNELELFAEGFAEYTSGSKSEFGQAFGKFLKRWY